MRRAESPRRHPIQRWQAQRAGRARDEAGFTLIEVLVVLAIIGLIVGLVGPRVLDYLSSSKEKAAQIQIQSLSTALELYYLDTGRYPGAEDGLQALVENASRSASWNGPYLKGGTVPLDPWGRPYLYRFPGQNGAFDLLSLGLDGIEGASGDVAGSSQ